MTLDVSHTSNVFDIETASHYTFTAVSMTYDGSLSGTALPTSLGLNNLSSNDYDYDEDLLSQVIFYFWLWKVITPTLFAALAVCGTVGNTLVVYVVISRPQMRTVTNVLLVSLAFADIAFLVICGPSTAYRYAADTWPFGDAVCRFTNYLNYVTSYVTVYTLVAITGFRYASVVYPEQTEGFRTRRNSIVLALVVWVASALGNLPALPAFVVKTLEGFSYCGMEQNSVRSIIIGFFAVGYVIPLTAVALLNMLIVLHLAMQRNGVAARAVTSTASLAAASSGTAASSAVDGIARRSRRRHIRTARILFPLVIVFGLTWLPQHVQGLVALHTKLPEGHWYEVLRVLWNGLAYGNSCANPFIYHRGSREFRRCFREVLSSWIGWIRCPCSSKQKLNVNVTITSLHDVAE